MVRGYQRIWLKYVTNPPKALPDHHNPKGSIQNASNIHQGRHARHSALSYVNKQRLFIESIWPRHEFISERNAYGTLQRHVQ